MRIYRSVDELPAFAATAVTVGSFDGVHRGHRALLDRLVDEARRIGGESIVVTFDPHPRIALGRGEGLQLLATPEEKTAWLEQAGVDVLVVVPFDRAFSRLTGAEFADWLVGRLGARTLVAGYDHRFGHDRCDCETAAAGKLRVVRVAACEIDGVRVSSSAIRRLLAAGRVAEAEKLAGHPLSLHPISE